MVCLSLIRGSCNYNIIVEWFNPSPIRQGSDSNTSIKDAYCRYVPYLGYTEGGTMALAGAPRSSVTWN